MQNKTANDWNFELATPSSPANSRTMSDAEFAMLLLSERIPGYHVHSGRYEPVVPYRYMGPRIATRND